MRRHHRSLRIASVAVVLALTLSACTLDDLVENVTQATDILESGGYGLDPGKQTPGLDGDAGVEVAQAVVNFYGVGPTPIQAYQRARDKYEAWVRTRNPALVSCIVTYRTDSRRPELIGAKLSCIYSLF